MITVTRVAIGIFLASCFGGLIAFFSGALWWRWMFAPALFFSGAASFGHLITLDDDFPGEWSSPADPDKARSFFRRSLAELAAKMVVFGALALLVASDWSSG